ncbi:unnamed protein product [Coffea canephora]|uniref:Uncharacterized protein n=1 Tax=Coffea canephora TaxID=49390 RepID=A0A068USD1_COFCA|nr:unnamed protein product [Coffea canephora]
MLRLYFVKGGKSRWLSSRLETAAWPLIFIPLTISYLHRRKNQGHSTSLFFFINYLLCASGLAHLPVSASSIIVSTQLAFTAIFAYLLVKNKFTASSLVLFDRGVGLVVLALHTRIDRPEGESNSKKMHVLGFVLRLASSAVNGLISPLTELAYKKAKQAICYALVMEIQTILVLVCQVPSRLRFFLRGSFTSLLYMNHFNSLFVYGAQNNLKAICIQFLLFKLRSLGRIC